VKGANLKEFSAFALEWEYRGGKMRLSDFQGFKIVF
jgi:hypothetical protein